MTNELVIDLRGFWHGYINFFLGWHGPTLSCADRIVCNIVGGLSHKFVMEPGHNQATINSKIIRSSTVLIQFHWQLGQLENDFVEEHQVHKFQAPSAYLTMEWM